MAPYPTPSTWGKTTAIPPTMSPAAAGRSQAGRGLFSAAEAASMIPCMKTMAVMPARMPRMTKDGNSQNEVIA